MNRSEERIRNRILQDEIKRLGSLLRQEEAAHLATKGNVRFTVMLVVNEQVLTGQRKTQNAKIRTKGKTGFRF